MVAVEIRYLDHIQFSVFQYYMQTTLKWIGLEAILFIERVLSEILQSLMKIDFDVLSSTVWKLVSGV